ncbi:hydantoinase/oxoprolinase family protein [Streptomyces sp. NPDC046805]|uniref:hydantoinase/oxoprolinase family protein n=1 Tax=Streptomyces sp. NPDC046805 TaxID=3155134 RepID=UPI0033CEB541
MTMHVGVDVGGTFTDAVAIIDGTTVRGKALSTQDITSGILDALAALRRELALDEQQFLPGIERFVLGNTIVTNAVDELRFAKVGLITTAGFKDTLRISRSARGESRDPHDHRPHPSLLDRRHIVEARERVDSRGRVVVPLDPDAVRATLRRLVEEDDVEAIAVCLLWSFRNPDHERLIRDLIASTYPRLRFTLSSDVAPVYREYERTVTTVLDAAVKPLVLDHFAKLEERLAAAGLRVRPQIMQVHGGFLSVEDTLKAPINMFNSGPVGGVAGARLLGESISRSRVLTADMGGTSLDAAAIVDGKLRTVTRAQIAQFPTSLTAVDIETIGAGGGSLGWVDERGMLRVGPHSAGSRPGPVCYGLGGTQPTITDATLVMGLINPDYYLGGGLKLDVDGARSAMTERLGRRLDMAPETVANGMYRLTVQQMANAVRKITINRGYDPREFTMMNFGGAMGLFAAAVASEVGISEILVPANAAVFSAWGLMHADAVYTQVRTSPWDFDSPAADLEDTFVELEAGATSWFERESIPARDRQLVREADMKFVGQIFEVTTTLPQGPIGEPAKRQIRERFIRDYEAEFGAGTAWSESPIALINARVRAVGRSEALPRVAGSRDGGVTSSESYQRRIVDPATGRHRVVDVHRGITPGQPVSGPCLLEEPDTTVYLPAGAEAELSHTGDLLIALDHAAAR